MLSAQEEEADEEVNIGVVATAQEDEAQSAAGGLQVMSQAKGAKPAEGLPERELSQGNSRAATMSARDLAATDRAVRSPAGEPEAAAGSDSSKSEGAA